MAILHQEIGLCSNDLGGCFMSEDKDEKDGDFPYGDPTPRDGAKY